MVRGAADRVVAAVAARAAAVRTMPSLKVAGTLSRRATGAVATAPSRYPTPLAVVSVPAWARLQWSSARMAGTSSP